MTSAEDPVEVTFTDDDEITVTVLPETDSEEPEGFSLEENPHVFDSTQARPGAHAIITVSVNGETEEVSVPVFDGSLERYRSLLPQE